MKSGAKAPHTKAAKDTEPKALFLAVLTSFAAKRKDPPLISLSSDQDYITALNSPSVVWVIRVEADSYDAAVSEVAHCLREGKGQITNAGTHIYGFTFEDQS